MNRHKEFTLKETIIPDIVQAKADAAFSSIRMEGADMINNKKKRFFRKPAVIAAAAAILVLGAGTIYAAVNHFWSQGSTEMIQADPEQQQEMESSGIATVFDSSLAVTSDGITVAPREMIIDRHIARITFVVTGIDKDVLNDYSDNIMFDWIDYNLDNASPGTWFGGGKFYREVSITDDGTVNINSVIDDNGDEAMEFIAYIQMDSVQDSIIGKTLHIDFNKLGISFEKAGSVSEYVSEGKWGFDIRLQGQDSTVTIDEYQTIYEPYAVASIELSPLSIQINFDVNGEVSLGEPDVPMLYGLKMTDGTVIDLDSALEDGKPVFFSNLGKYVYKDGNTYTYDAEERSFPVSAFCAATFNTVINSNEVAEVILQPWGEAYMWGDDIPDEIIAQEYGGEIPFERIDHSNMKLYYVSVNQ